jgi:hypothetical protein
MVPKLNLLQLNALDELVGDSSLLQRIAGKSDVTMNLLKKFITQGWPAKVPVNLLPYSKNRLEYSIQNGIIYKDIRVVPANCFKSEILRLLHADHQGIVRTIRMARQYFWWPGIDADVNSLIQRCTVCQTNARKRSGMNLASWQETHEFMERVHVDIGYHKGKRFMILVDDFSKWTDVQEVADLSAAASAAALRRTFKYVGLPKTLVSDSGTNVVAEEMEKWLCDNYIKHVRSPPGHHQSNGLAERMVQELQFFLCKSDPVGSDYERAVIAFCLHHNTTPAANGAIAADFVFMKTPRTRLSAQFTERVLPTAPIPVFIRVENKSPVPSEIVSKHGDNTWFDNKNRLVHDSDVVPRIVEQDVPVEKEVEDAHEDEKTSVVHTSPKVASPTIMEPRRGIRDRKKPERYGYL